MKEALRIRAELVLRRCQKELYRLRVDKLRNQVILERNDVEKVEGSFFARLRNNYEEKLGKEKAEALKVRLELERVEKILSEAEEKLPALEGAAKERSIIWKELGRTDLTEEENELLDWCEVMELAEEVVTLNNRCMEEGQAARLCAYSGPGDREKNLIFQEDMEILMQKIEPFLSKVGRVRFLPGMRVKTARGTVRNYTLNGKTLAFFWKDHPSTEIDILDFDLRELYGSWAVGDTLERKLRELDALEALFRKVAEEKIKFGEKLLREMTADIIESKEKDIFGFEIGE